MAYARKAQYAPPVSQEVMEQPPIWEEEVQTEIPHPFSMEEPDEHAEIDDIDGMDADSSENTEVCHLLFRKVKCFDTIKFSINVNVFDSRFLTELMISMEWKMI